MNEDLPPALRHNLPHAGWLQTLTAVTFAGFCFVTYYVLERGTDMQTQGILVGCWITLVTGASAFWLGSSSGGKAKS